MLTAPIRLSASGPNIGNELGGPLEFGPGAQLRMDDNSWIIGDGSVVIPTAATIVYTAGFAGDVPCVVSLADPAPTKRYAIEVEFDTINNSTNIDTFVQVFLDVTNDGGATWHEIASNQHHPSAAADLASDVNSGSHMALHQRMIQGGAMGVEAGDASLIVRCRLAAPAYLGGAGVELYSPYTSGASTFSRGTFYMRLTELF